MPQLVRDGAYLPERTVTDNGRISDKQATIILLRRKSEERLARQHALKERQFAFKEQIFRHRAFENHIAHLRRSGQLGEAVIVNVETEVMEDLLDMDLSSLKIAEKPVTEEATLSPTEIARQLRSNAYTVGRIISRLGIRGDTRYSREIPNKAKHCCKQITSYLYKPCVVGMVRDELNRQNNQQLSLLSGAVKYGLESLNRSE